MKPEIKKQWIEALRSGDYEQGDGYLRTDRDEFCCLGVLCDIHHKAIKIAPSIRGSYYHYFDSECFIPQEIIKWSGILNYSPHLIYKNKSENLTTLNDLKGLTFNQIADLIEEQL